jgi:TPR repeat protein
VLNQSTYSPKGGELIKAIQKMIASNGFFESFGARIYLNYHQGAVHHTEFYDKKRIYQVLNVPFLISLVESDGKLTICDSRNLKREILSKNGSIVLDIDQIRSIYCGVLDENASEVTYKKYTMDEFIENPLDDEVTFDHIDDAVDVETLWSIGEMYIDNGYLNCDREKAIHFYSLAAKKGCLKSYARLGQLHLAQRTSEQGIQFFITAANQGHAPSQFNLGQFYLYGRLVEKDIEKAFHYLQLAADQGEVSSLRLLGNLYLTRSFCYNTLQVSLERECLKELADSKVIFDITSSIEGVEEKGLKYLQAAADQYHAPSLYQLAVHYLTGEYIEKNREKAMNYLFASAEQNYLFSLPHVIKTLLFGTGGIAKDVDKGLQYLMLGADQEQMSSLSDLGKYYLTGKFLQQDISKGVRYLEKAVNLGCYKARLYLGTGRFF